MIDLTVIMAADDRFHPAFQSVSGRAPRGYSVESKNTMQSKSLKLSAVDLARHPSMHRTDTLDMFTVAYGEIYLVTDTDEVLLKPGDTAVVQGVNHAWSNKSDKPCMIVGVMVYANPWPKDKYPPSGP